MKILASLAICAGAMVGVGIYAGYKLRKAHEEEAKKIMSDESREEFEEAIDAVEEANKVCIFNKDECCGCCDGCKECDECCDCYDCEQCCGNCEHCEMDGCDCCEDCNGEPKRWDKNVGEFVDYNSPDEEGRQWFCNDTLNCACKSREVYHEGCRVMTGSEAAAMDMLDSEEEVSRCQDNDIQGCTRLDSDEMQEAKVEDESVIETEVFGNVSEQSSDVEDEYREPKWD